MSFVKYVISSGGCIKPLLIPSNYLCGPALTNPSVIVINDQIIVNLRNVNYTLYHSEASKFEHAYGPLTYVHPENDAKLRTVNHITFLSPSLELIKHYKVDTSAFDTYQPKWDFVGLEDARLVLWDSKLYLCGVRRDLDSKGTGRMELSEISLTENSVKEVSRRRIPGPPPDNEYCMKNCTPIEDRPFTLLKWTNPTALMSYDPVNNSSIVAQTSEAINLPHDLRGGSQVLRYKNGYISIVHETHLYSSEQGRKNATYLHRFILWDTSFKIKKVSRLFTFLNFKIEFCCGLAKHNSDYLITFGAQDNCAYILKASEDCIESFIDAQPSYL
jgi:hypothetical protein